MQFTFSLFTIVAVMAVCLLIGFVLAMADSHYRVDRAQAEASKWHRDVVKHVGTALRLADIPVERLDAPKEELLAHLADALSRISVELHLLRALNSKRANHITQFEKAIEAAYFKLREASDQTSRVGVYSRIDEAMKILAEPRGFDTARSVRPHGNLTPQEVIDNLKG